MYVDAAFGQLDDRARVVQATLDDLDQGRTALLPEKATMRRHELTFDTETGEPTIVEWDEATVRRDHARADGMLALARRVSVQPDADLTRPGPFDGLLTEESPTPLRVLAATFATAMRTGLPLYSDDRHLRFLARRAGMRTLSTVGLLDALHANGALTTEDVDRGRRESSGPRGSWA
jgi:hypothetical protein